MGPAFPHAWGAQGGAAAAATALRLFGELPAPTAPAFTAAIASCGVAREWEQLGDAKAIGTSPNLGKWWENHGKRMGTWFFKHHQTWSNLAISQRTLTGKTLSFWFNRLALLGTYEDAGKPSIWVSNPGFRFWMPVGTTMYVVWMLYLNSPRFNIIVFSVLIGWKPRK